MSNHPKINSLKGMSSFAGMLLFAGYGMATPSIENAELTKLEQGASVVIRGHGFGERGNQDSPVLFDFADKAYEYGVKNTHQSAFPHGSSIPRTDEDPDTIWAKSSANAVIDRQGPLRSAHSAAQYLVEGRNGYLGWPTAYGGLETPTDNERLYVSWYVQVKHDPRYNYSISLSDSEGKFIPGEPVEINGTDGEFLGIADAGPVEGMHQFTIPRHLNNLKGHELVGLDSGAVTVFPENFAGGSGDGYERQGSNKYLRVWEDPNGQEGIRLSWTQSQITQSGISSRDNGVAAPITPNEWHFMEMFLDAGAGYVRAKVNGEEIFKHSFGDDKRVEGKWSPTIALIGFNGDRQVFQETRFDDIYMDKKFSRVFISDKPKFSEVENPELQVPVKWSGSELEFRLNLGALDYSAPQYIYIVTEDGSYNEEGFPLCDSCLRAPEAVTLEVD